MKLSQTFVEIRHTLEKLINRRVVTTAEALCCCGCGKTLPSGNVGVVVGVTVAKGSPLWVVSVQCGASLWQFDPCHLAFVEAGDKPTPFQPGDIAQLAHDIESAKTIPPPDCGVVALLRATNPR